MDWVTVGNLAGGSLGLLLAARLALSRTENRMEAWLLAGFMGCVAMLVLDSLCYRQGWFARVPWFYGIANPFIAASGPLFFLYACAATDPGFRWRRWWWLHFIPSGLFLLGQIPVTFLPVEEKLAMARQDLQPAGALWQQLVSTGVFDLYLLIYFGAAWWRFRRCRERIAESREEGRAHPLRGMAVFSTLVLGLNVGSAALDFTPWMQSGMTLLGLAAVVGFFALFWAISDPGALVGNVPSRVEVAAAVVRAAEQAEPAAVEEPAAPPTDPSPEPEHDEETRRLAAKLVRLMQTERPYLVAGLSLQGLADRLGTTRHRLSEAIKCAYGATFYQVIAAQRAREVGRVLGTAAGRARTIADIAFAAGFNTLSAFNAAFRAEFGMTPKAYRETIRGRPDAEQSSRAVGVKNKVEAEGSAGS